MCLRFLPINIWLLSEFLARVRLDCGLNVTSLAMTLKREDGRVSSCEPKQGAMAFGGEGMHRRSLGCHCRSWFSVDRQMRRDPSDQGEPTCRRELKPNLRAR